MTDPVEAMADVLCQHGCGTSDECEWIARAALTAIADAGPTEEMWMAGDAKFHDDYSWSFECCRDVWAAMLAAAPKMKP